jgi:hypothetical protein
MAQVWSFLTQRLRIDWVCRQTARGGLILRELKRVERREAEYKEDVFAPPKGRAISDSALTINSSSNTHSPFIIFSIMHFSKALCAAVMAATASAVRGRLAGVNY